MMRNFRKTLERLLWALPAILACSTLWLWYTLKKSDDKALANRLAEGGQHIADKMNSQFQTVDDIMHACGAFFEGSDFVSRSEWRKFVKTLDPTEYNKGVQVVAFIKRVPAAQLAAHVSEVRAEKADYKVYPAGEREEYYLSLYQYPDRAQREGRRRIGYDAGSEPALMAAMRRACDTGQPSATNTILITPLIPGATVQNGFAVFMPVFRRGRPADTAERRRANLSGFVYVAVLTRKMAVDAMTRTQDSLWMKLYDSPPGGDPVLVYDSMAGGGGGAALKGYVPEYSTALDLRWFGRSWRAAFFSLPSFSEIYKRGHNIVLISGFLLSLLSLWLAYVQAQRGRALDAEEAANESLKVTKFVMDSCATPIFLVRPDASFYYVNEAATGLLGYSREELVKMTALDLNPQYVTIEGWEKNWAEVSRKGRTVYEAGLKAKDGGTVPVEITATHVSYWDKELKCVFIHDLTARRRYEDELKKAKTDADAANRTKSVFLANMSHEIRTPLNAILGFSQLLLRDPSATPAQQKQFRTINRSGSHLLDLINDILEMSKIEARRVTLDEAAFDLRAMAEDVDRMFRDRAAAKGLQLAVEGAGELPRFVTGDEKKLRQVLVNLVGNALKFTDEGGIALRLRSRVDADKGLRFIAEVEDTGPGMDPGELQKLFQPFEQGRTGRSAGGGTGLGLAICRQYARLMGGDISVKSEAGKGSVFTLEAGIKESTAAAAAGRADLRRVRALKPGQPPCRVLVADDKADNREFLEQLLHQTGFETRLAVNGEEAVQGFSGWRPRIILMDIKMPVMDGYAATRAIRSAPGGKDVGIIVLSASSFGDVRKEALAQGADDYLPKPFRESDLFEKIGALARVEYDYEAPPAEEPAAAAPVTPEALARLAPETAAALKEAASGGDFDRVKEIAAGLGGAVPGLAETLLTLAGRFDSQAILRLLGGR